MHGFGAAREKHWRQALTRSAVGPRERTRGRAFDRNVCASWKDAEGPWKNRRTEIWGTEIAVATSMVRGYELAMFALNVDGCESEMVP